MKICRVNKINVFFVESGNSYKVVYLVDRDKKDVLLLERFLKRINKVFRKKMLNFVLPFFVLKVAFQ